jgi:hypothetical protein
LHKEKGTRRERPPQVQSEVFVRLLSMAFPEIGRLDLAKLRLEQTSISTLNMSAFGGKADITQALKAT